MFDTPLDAVVPSGTLEGERQSIVKIIAFLRIKGYRILRIDGYVFSRI